MNVNSRVDRRKFLRLAAISSAVLVGGGPLIGFGAEKGKKGLGAITPVEDLMREHGALRRIFLIYEEALRRLGAKEEMNPALLNEAVGIVQRVAHDYHEKLEEEYVFPPLMKAKKSVDAVYALIAQHQAGKVLTQKALSLSTAAHFKTPSDVDALSSALTQFVRMYRPHAAREDTAIFFDFKKILSPEGYERLGKQFEEREQKVIGKDGLDGVIAAIDRIETELGIHEISKYSPQG